MKRNQFNIPAHVHNLYIRTSCEDRQTATRREIAEMEISIARSATFRDAFGNGSVQ